MNPDESSVSLPSSATSTVQRILRPLNLSRWRCNFLKFKGWTTFKQSQQTGHQETSIRQGILHKLPIHNLEVMFLDGTPVIIEYVFDPTSRNRNYVFVKLATLLPLLGGVIPSTTEVFSSIIELCFFVKKHVHLDECENFHHASCQCHLIREDQELPDFVVDSRVDICEYEHFHHFCWKHLVSWLYNYLNLLILLHESKQHFDEEIAHLYSMMPDNVLYFQTGKRTTPEFLFKAALNFYMDMYESDSDEE